MATSMGGPPPSITNDENSNSTRTATFGRAGTKSNFESESGQPEQSDFSFAPGVRNGTNFNNNLKKKADDSKQRG